MCRLACVSLAVLGVCVPVSAKRIDVDLNGGGLFSYEGSSPKLEECTLSMNASATGGGASIRQSTATFSRCEIVGNFASWAGGVYCIEDGTELTNCTIAGNQAHSGGIAGFWRSSASLMNCTIWNNAPGARGDVYCDGAVSPTFVNSIFPSPAPEATCGNISHSLTDTDPMFVREGLFDFGRFVTFDVGGEAREMPLFVIEKPDYHLEPGSPAIDGGTGDGAPGTDIEGKLRPCGSGVDIGAYEMGDCPPPTPFRRADSNADGKTNITDAVFTLLYRFSGGEAPACMKAADSDDSGKVDLTDAVYVLNHLFLGGPSPEGPFPGCGPDPTIDELKCESFPACEEP